MKVYVEYGNGVGSIWFDDVICVGNEMLIVNCFYNEWGNYDCMYVEDVGVICVLISGNLSIF